MKRNIFQRRRRRNQTNASLEKKKKKIPTIFILSFPGNSKIESMKKKKKMTIKNYCQYTVYER